MALFKRSAPAMKAVPEYPVYPDFCWNDQQADDFARFAGQPGRPVGDVVRATLDRLVALRPDPERTVLHNGIGVMALASTPFAEVAAAFTGPLAAADPADRADALAMLAVATTHAAWAVRGGGLASTVGQDAWPVFHRMLEDADETGRQALDLVPDHPVAATNRLTTGRGLGVSSAEHRQRFDVARRRRPTLYGAHVQMLQNVCRKWSGSHELMFDFAQGVAADAPVGDPVVAMLPVAHLEYWLDEDDEALVARVRARDRALVAQASDKWLAGGQQALAHPQVVGAHQQFGWFFVLAGDVPRAHAHLSRTGGRISTDPWAYYNDPHRAYRIFLRDAGVRL